MARKIKILIFFLITIFILFAKPIIAWNGNTHKFLWQEALEETKIDLKDCDKSEIKKILNTSPIQPDREGRKDLHNCFKDYCPALDKMAELISEAKKETYFCNKMFLLGKASHYLTDALNPLHQKLVSNSCHNNFESKVWKWIKLGFKGNVSVKCGRGKGAQVFEFNKNSFDELINQIKTDILAQDWKKESKKSRKAK